jgi:DNA polymerase-4
MDRVILLIDMNAYFASVEQVSNPALRGKPIVVCGEGRTVVTTASYEARKYGVKTGMTLPEAKSLCPALIPVIGTMDKYVDTSFRIHTILLEFTDRVEPFSIDECFLDITPLCRSGRVSPKDAALKIKQRIKEELGLLCSVGIGPNKLIAKLASKMQKPDGLVQINKEDIPRIFVHLPVEKLQGVGVGRHLSEKFQALGITTAQELGEAPISMLEAHFGITGYHLKRMGKGEDDAPVKKYGESEPVKSVGHSYTLPKDTWDMSVIRAYLLMLSEKVGVRLRREHLTGRTVHLTVRYADFTSVGKQTSLKRYIKTGQEIYTTACGIFKTFLPLQKAVRLLGVSISNVVVDERSPFLWEDMEKQCRIAEAMDEINKKYGEFTVKPSSLIIAENFGTADRCGMIGKYFLKKK